MRGRFLTFVGGIFRCGGADIDLSAGFVPLEGKHPTPIDLGPGFERGYFRLEAVEPQAYSCWRPLWEWLDTIYAGCQWIAEKLRLHIVAEFCVYLRARWRQLFESTLVEGGDLRVRESIRLIFDAWAHSGYSIRPEMEEAVYQRFVRVTLADTALLHEMRTLESLPISRVAVQLRMLALDQAIQKYLADCALAVRKEVGE